LLADLRTVNMTLGRSERSQPGLHRAHPTENEPGENDLDHARNPSRAVLKQEGNHVWSPLLRLEHEKLVGPGFSAPDFALAARELPYTGVGVA